MKKIKISIFIVLFIILFLNVYFYTSDKKSTIDSDIYNYDLSDKEYYHTNDNEFMQKIYSKENNLNGIEVFLTVDEYFYKGTLLEYEIVNMELELYDDKYNLIEKYKYEKIFSKDNRIYINFKFPKIEDSKDKVYYLKFKNFEKVEFCIIEALKSTTNGLYVNGEHVNRSILYFNSYETNKTPLYYYIIPMITMFFGAVSIILINKIKIIEKKYLVLAITFGILILFLFPACNGHDEGVHYARIYDLSKGHMLVNSKGKWPIIKMPTKIYDVEFIRYDEVQSVYNKVPFEPTTKVNGEYTSVYSIFSYLPEVVGFKLISFFTNNAFILYYFTRLSNLLFCIFMIYYAIKIIPFGKKTMMFIGLLPSVIKTSCIVTADGILLSSFMLFIAKILQLAYTDKKVEKTDYLILLITGIFVAMSKLIYIPLCMLLVLIPLNRKEKGLKRNLIIVFTICLFMAMFWNILASINLLSGQGVNVMYYLKYYSTHIIEFVQITIHTFIIYIGRFINDIFGGTNEWYGTAIKDGGIVPIVYLISYIMLVLNGENKLNKRDRYIIFGLIIVTYLLISTVMLFTCTPVHFESILGIQGRYFLVFLICIYLILAKKKKDNINIDIYTYIIIFTNLYFCLDMFAYYA